MESGTKAVVAMPTPIHDAGHDEQPHQHHHRHTLSDAQMAAIGWSACAYIAIFLLVAIASRRFRKRRGAQGRRATGRAAGRRKKR